MDQIPELAAIEFPGYSNNPASLLKLIGGPNALMNCIKNNLPVALYMRDDLFSRPIYGHIMPTSNLAIKIIKQRNSKTGEFRIKYEIIGAISQTVRFRSLADYQVLPDEKNSIVKLRKDLQEWNVDAIEKFRFSHEKGIVEQLSNIPPPLFSPIETSLDYKYSQNPAVIKVRVDENGQSKIKTINKNSNTEKLHCAILDIKNPQVPLGPPEEFKPLDVPEAAIQETLNLFQNQRPVWSRTALLNSMSPEYTKHIKQLLPRVAYLIPKGGFKDTWVRYGYDPRKDPSSAKWQMISMRLSIKKSKSFRGFYSSRVPQYSAKPDPNSHIFDGSNFNGTINTFQICDITDQDILPFLELHGRPRSRFSKRSGWFSRKFVDHLRKMMTNKAATLRGEQTSYCVGETFFEDKESTDSSSSSSSSEDEEEMIDEPEDLGDSVKSRVNELMRLLRGQQGQDDQDDMEEYSFFQDD